MGKKLVAILFVAFPMLYGCSTTGAAVATGAGTGAALGAGVGALADPGPKGAGRIKNLVIGGAAGAALGAGAGYLMQKTVTDHEQEAYASGKRDGQKVMENQVGDTSEPVLLPPQVEAHFVPDQVRGNVFVPSHFEYRIVQPARWSK